MRAYNPWGDKGGRLKSWRLHSEALSQENQLLEGVSDDDDFDRRLSEVLHT